MHWTPVNPSALHSHNRTIMLQQPLSWSDQIVGECTKYFDLVLFIPIAAGENNTS